jgi:hypothetical protein
MKKHSIDLGNGFTAVRCSNSVRFDLFEARVSKTGKSRNDDVAYGVTLERAIEHVVSMTLDKEGEMDLGVYLKKYKKECSSILDRVDKVIVNLK